MAQKQPPYVGGVGTIGVGDTTFTVTGALDDTNCIEGDHVRDPATGYESRVLERLTVQTFRVPPWRGAALAGAAYELYPDSNLRGGYQSAVTTQLLARLSAKGLVWNLPPEFASPTAAKWGADENQRVFSESLRTWWVMQGGAWVVTGSPYGMMPSANLADLTDASAARANIGAPYYSNVLQPAAADFNLMGSTGFFNMGPSPVNGPVAGCTYNSLIVTSHSNIVYQICTGTGGDNAGMWMRQGIGTAPTIVWLPWKRLLLGSLSVKQTIITSTGNFIPTLGAYQTIVECCGGGGGGGASYSSNQSYTFMTGGGGGGGGTYSRRVLTPAQIGAYQAVTIGAGGSGGTSGSDNASSGGTTSFGTLCVAGGGLRGRTGDASNLGYAGGGGKAGTGDLVIPGKGGFAGVNSKGDTWLNFISDAGRGGDSFLGAGGEAVTNFTGSGASTNGTPGSGYGGGGGGSYSRNYNMVTPTTGSGGSGSPGVVVATEFIRTE